jgi:beta-lactamase regulating signal transducer with metallopeptidase domain
MSLATIGWAVVHALWAGTAIAGITALGLALIGDTRARLRHGLAMAALVAMAVAPAIIAATAIDPMTRAARIDVTEALEATVGFAQFVSVRRSLVPAAAIVWMAGVAFGLARLAVQWQRLRQWRHSPAGTPSSDLDAQLRALVTSMRVARSLAVHHSTRATVPMVFGWRRPTLLLPHGIDDVLTTGQLRGILVHELAHVRRRDYLANLCQAGLDALLWFHPAARWLSGRARTEREYCCDDEVMRSGVDVSTYARALAALADRRDDGRLMMAAASGPLLDRLQRLAGRPREVMTVRTAGLALAAAMAVAGVVFVLALAVPPAVPLDAKLRRRTPAPPGLVVPNGPTRPRTLQPR